MARYREIRSNGRKLTPRCRIIRFVCAHDGPDTGHKGGIHARRNRQRDRRRLNGGSEGFPCPSRAAALAAPCLVCAHLLPPALRASNGFKIAVLGDGSGSYAGSPVTLTHEDKKAGRSEDLPAVKERNRLSKRGWILPPSLEPEYPWRCE